MAIKDILVFVQDKTKQKTAFQLSQFKFYI